MAFTRTSLNILIFLQKLFSAPITFVFTSSEIILTLNPMFTAKKYCIRQNLTWKTCHYFFFWWNIFAFGRLVLLLNEWKYKKDFEQVGYYILVFALSFMIIQAYYTIETHTDQLPVIFAQRFQMVKYDFKGKYMNYLII